RGQSAAEQMEFLAMPINVATPTGELAGAETAERTHELGTHRYGDLRGSGWRGRPPVGSKIDQRHVCLVTDCRDERDHACGRRADHDFLVERPEIFQGAAPARDNDQLGPR